MATASNSGPQGKYKASPSLHDPWIDSSFLKDAKMRVQERYWRRESSIAFNVPQDTKHPVQLRIIPDGLTWRKYLGLISALVETYKVPVEWYLLESAAELLDWRNQAPCLEHADREAAAPHERTQMQRLAQRHAGAVVPVVDLSIRASDGEDEWDLLGYEHMDIEERSRHALNRAARMVVERTRDGTGNADTPVWILAPHELDETSDDGVRFVNWEELLGFLVAQSVLSPDQFEKLVELQHVCEREYTRRNTPKGPVDGTSNGFDIDTQMEYLSESEIQKGLRTGDLIRGRFDVTKENVREAFVSAEGTKHFVDGTRRHFNRAMHYDVVVVQPLPESEWGRPVGRRRLVHHRDGDDDKDGAGDSLLETSDPPVPSARVVALLQSSRRVFVATMIDSPVNDESAVLVVPMDMRVSKIRVHTKSWRRFVGQRLLIEVDAWEVSSNFPSGRCIEILGLIGDLETEISCLLHENQVALDPFSVSALACLPPEGDAWTIPCEEIKDRRDLRQSRQIFSVDPPGCQDIDDTMHTMVLPNGDIEVGVHIADVTYFVQHNSALDKEAQVRSTTFYLVDRRFDMLPSVLSSDLCSLHGGVDRLAVSVIWTFSSDFKDIKSTWYGRTVIRNCAAMTYQQADNILSDMPPDSPGKQPPPRLTAGGPVDRSLLPSLKDHLGTLTRLARKLRRDREEIGGAVDLSSGDLGTELKFSLGADGKPVKVAPKADKEIHHTIAEMMILANSHVASKIFGAFADAALLRIHRPVEEERFEDLREVLEASGVKKFDGRNNMALAKSLKDAERRDNGSGTIVNSLVKSLATRAMSEAQYVCTGDGEQGADLSHYGLGLGHYTHFTSPIRRYADVVVHKQLLAALADRGNDTRLLREPVSVMPLKRLPKSNTISVLGGDEVVDSLIHESSALTLGTGPIVNATPSLNDSLAVDTHRPYKTVELSKVCERLNLQNRQAKHSSMECQKLFLSLYFRSHSEVAQAVVVSLRTNGFWVYVPRFDIRGPVFLKGMDGDIQLDPALLGLPPDAGSPPSVGFASAQSSRRLPAATVKLDDECLEVSMQGGTKALKIQLLEVVTVHLSCDTWDVRARVPNPRFHLQASVGGDAMLSSAGSRAVASTPRITADLLNRDPDGRNDRRSHATERLYPPSMADLLASFPVEPGLQSVPLRSRDGNKRKVERSLPMKGRFVYGDFINPDTRSAAQEVAQQAAAQAASERRASALSQVARRDEYDKTKTIERTVTSRQHKLAADKRSSRRQKASK